MPTVDGNIYLPEAIEGASEVPSFRLSDYSLKDGVRIIIDDDEDGYIFEMTDLEPLIPNTITLVCTRLTRLNVEGFRYLKKDTFWQIGDNTTDTLFPCKIKKIYIKTQ